MVLLSYAVFGAIILGVILAIEAVVIGQVRFLEYTWSAIGMMILASGLNNFALTF